jgi:hypothetical protein
MSNNLQNPVGTLASCLAHAMYQGFPEIVYETRDWSRSKEEPMAMVSKTRHHSEYDVEVYAVFAQVWASTALGFGGLGGQAITTAYTTVLRSSVTDEFCIYFGGRFAYRIVNANERFYEDIKQRRMDPVKDHQRYQQSNKDGHLHILESFS